MHCRSDTKLPLININSCFVPVQADKLHNSCLRLPGQDIQQLAMLAEHHDCYVHCLTNFDCIAAEDTADLGFCYSAGLQALVGETKVHLRQKGDVL